MQDLSLLDDSLTPLWISMHLSVEIPYCSIDYEFSAAVHQFLISHRGRTSRICLPSSLLNSMDADALMRWLRLATDQVFAAANSRNLQHDSTVELA